MGVNSQKKILLSEIENLRVQKSEDILFQKKNIYPSKLINKRQIKFSLLYKTSFSIKIKNKTRKKTIFFFY